MKICAWTLVLATLSACAAASPEKINHRSLPEEFVQGSFLVTATADMTPQDLEGLGKNLADELSCTVKEPQRIRWSESGVVSRELHDTFHLKFENCDLTKENTESILAELSGESQILSVEAEALARATPIVDNDPYKSSQDHLDFIKRDEACEAAALNSEPIVVAVIDTGVDRDHPDLIDSFFRDSRGEVIGANFVGRGSSMPPDQDWDDGDNHGTHVAGLIAAAAGNGKGGVGVASCANVKIMPIRVLNDEGEGTTIEIERGVKWAADHGAHIINLSLGFTARSYAGRASFYRSVYADVARRNVLVLAAAGNDGFRNGTPESGSRLERWNFPSSYDHVISVAATNNNGSLTSFSNYGERVDIAAPGYRVLSTIPGSYARMSGTSMAAPVAAGAYALALASVRNNLDTDRVDVAVADELFDDATLAQKSLPVADVLAGGVLDASLLVKKMKARLPTMEEEREAEQPMFEQPEQPAEILKPSFQFVGLSDGDKAGWPQKMEMDGLPEGTYAVLLYWGESAWSFSKIYTQGVTDGVLLDDDSWYLYGNRMLKAVAVDRNYRILAQANVSLKGW